MPAMTDLIGVLHACRVHTVGQNPGHRPVALIARHRRATKLDPPTDHPIDKGPTLPLALARLDAEEVQVVVGEDRRDGVVAHGDRKLGSLSLLLDGSLCSGFLCRLAGFLGQVRRLPALSRLDDPARVGLDEDATVGTPATVLVGLWLVVCELALLATDGMPNEPLASG